MDLQPVHGIPALRADEYLVISDLHIGVEAQLLSKGFHIASRTDEMMDSIREAAGTVCSRIILIGDIKDSVPGSSRQEHREIPVFFDRLLDYFDTVDVVRGNHDTGLEEFLPGRVRIRPATGLRIFDTGFIHGHTWPSEDVMAAGTLVMGHAHPAVMFSDGIGRQMTEPCWLRGRFRDDAVSDRFPALPERFVVLPAFNRMLGGSPVNVIGEPLLGPVLSSELIDIDNASIHLLDGIDLGSRGDLMVEGRSRDRFRKDGKR